MGSAVPVMNTKGLFCLSEVVSSLTYSLGLSSHILRRRAASVERTQNRSVVAMGLWAQQSLSL